MTDLELQLTAQRDDLMQMLEELTPGGSEFYHSPLRCYEFIQDRLATTAAIAKERNELRAEVARLKAPHA